MGVSEFNQYDLSDREIKTHNPHFVPGNRVQCIQVNLVHCTRTTPGQCGYNVVAQPVKQVVRLHCTCSAPMQGGTATTLYSHCDYNVSRGLDALYPGNLDTLYPVTGYKMGVVRFDLPDCVVLLEYSNMVICETIIGPYYV